MSIEKIEIKLNGTLKFVYDSLLGILTKKIKENFNTILGDQILNTIMNIANDELG